MMSKFILIGLMLIQLAYGTSFTVDGSNIRASISNRDFNRISFKGDKINQAFFKSSEFLTQMDEINGQLFVLPRNKKAKHPLSMTVTSAGGLTQHFFFTPKDIGSQTVILKAPSKPVIVQKEDNNIEELINLLIKDTVKLESKAIKVSVGKGWKLRRREFVDFGNGYQGHVLTLMNVGKKQQKASVDLLWRSNTQALSIVENELRPRGVTKVYMITKGEFK